MRAQRPFVDRPMVESHVADQAAAMAARAWGLGWPEPIRRGMNALYACDRVVLRVGHTTAAASLAHELVGVLRAHGVPTVTPVVGLAGEFGGVSVTAWERVEATEQGVDWVAVGAAVRDVHAVAAAEVPAGYPVPRPSRFPWWSFEPLMAELADLLDDGARRGLAAAIERHAGWQQAIEVDPVICHGDVHPGNVLVSTTGPLLTDWDLLCTANRAWDHAMLTTYAERWGGDPAVYRAFAEGYGVDLSADPLTSALGDLRNVAATLMRVKTGRTDPTARTEAERRLRYWRGEPDPPVWRAQ